MVLYHASTNKGLKVLTPQKTLSSNEYIGDFVFATSNIKVAVMYLVPKGYPTLMNTDEPKPNIVICADEEDFLAHDHGGAVYVLSDRGFFRTPQAGLSQHELVCTTAVKPIRTIEYASALSALAKAGIAIRFTDARTFQKIINNSKQQDLIDKIPTYTVKL